MFVSAHGCGSTKSETRKVVALAVVAVAVGFVPMAQAQFTAGGGTAADGGSVTIGRGTNTNDQLAITAERCAVAIGPNTQALNAEDIAIGFNAFAGISGGNQIRDLAIGSSAVATGGQSTAVGDFSTATGNFGIAFGEGSLASGLAGTALGAGSTASGSLATAVGEAAIATGNNSFAGANAAVVSGTG